ncbi:hypothetical protein ACFQ3R_01230 [Mesonia ostreae]|uniref:Secreted protein n=1 Tax=Mesonia ostreae TaxID=861110 RepID=A0ABU2KHZ8_9FLAO|nr:hypothetical protein [Mesonia ostreae]MDT0294304.1 hypothetical protein [Mesonia ostreae]
MKYIASLVGIFAVCGISHAQLDNPTTTTTGGRLGGNTINSGGFTRSTPGLSKPNNSFYAGKNKDRLSPKEESLDITDQEEFLDPTKKFDPKYLAKKEGDKTPEEFKKNQYFGDFKSNGKFVKILCRDHMAVDGDMVQVVVNGKVQVSKISLQGSYTNVYINLEEGFNKIEVLALNQGMSGPNTAEFKVYDDMGDLIAKNIWNLATGFKASMIIVKEKEEE